MKRVLVIFFVLVEFIAGAQVTKPNYFTPVATAYEWNWGRFKYGFRPPTDTLATADSGSIAFKNGAWYGKLLYWSALGSGEGGGDVSSVFGRTGAVTAQSGDYSAFYVPLSRTINGYALSSNISLVKSDIGLSNVPNIDATLRGNHTGTQLASTISDFTTAGRNLFSAGSGISYNNSTGVISATGLTSVGWGDITGTLSSQTDLQTALNGKQATLSGTGIVKSTTGTISYLTDNSSNWNTAYSWGDHAGAGYEVSSNKSTSTSLGTSNTLYPSQNAVKTYVDNAISGIGTPGIDNVLAVGQSLSTNRSVSMSTNGWTFSGTNHTIGINSTLNSNSVGVYSINSNGGYGGFFGSDPSTANSIVRPLVVSRTTTGTAANGVGAGIQFNSEHDGGNNSFGVGIGYLDYKLSDASSTTFTTQIDLQGRNNTSFETFMNIQHDLVRINNNTDTLATLSDLRDGLGLFADEDFAHQDLIANANRVHNWNNFGLTIDSISNFTFRSRRTNSANRYTTLGGKSLDTGFDIVSRYDANNVSGVYVNNGNNTSNVYFDALGGGKYNALDLAPATGITLYPHLGELNIDTLNVSSGSNQRMVTWDITNGRLGYQTISGGGSGAVSSGSQYRIAVYNTAGTTVSENAAITGNRAIVSNANGLPVHATTTATEIGYVNGVTAPIQGQLDTKETAFLAANEEFTGSTSLSITISNTPITTKEETYYLNGLVIQSSRISRVGTSVTFSGFVREATDIITVKYSYAAP